MARAVGIKRFLPAKEPTVFLKKYTHVQTNGRERVKARRDGVTGDGLSGGGGGRSRVLGAGDARNDTGAHQAR